MISKTMQDVINEQINKELFSAYLYLSMSAHFETKNLGGFAKWLRVQAKEEQEHAMKFFDHLLERGGTVVLKALKTPAAEWKSNLEAFKEVLAHEEMISASINNLYEIALKEKDYPAQVMLQWFINEQVEEEKNANDILAQLGMIDAHGTAVLMLDKALGKREDD